MKKLSTLFTSLLLTFALLGCEEKQTEYEAQEQQESDIQYQQENVYIEEEQEAYHENEQEEQEEYHEHEYEEHEHEELSYQEQHQIEEEEETIQNVIIQQQIAQQLNYGYGNYNYSDVEHYYKTCLFTEGLDQDDYCEDVCSYEFDENSCDLVEDRFTAKYGKFGSSNSNRFNSDYNSYSKEYKSSDSSVIHIYEHRDISNNKKSVETKNVIVPTKEVIKKTASQSNIIKTTTNTGVKETNKDLTKESFKESTTSNSIVSKNTAPKSNISRKKEETQIATKISLTDKTQEAAQSNIKRKTKENTVVSTSSYKKSGSPYSCGNYSPATSSVKKGTSFTQKASCKQKEVQTIKYSDGKTKNNTKITTVTQTKTARGSKS